MPKPSYLPPPPVVVTLCWRCDHRGPVFKHVKLRDGVREIARCNLHGIDVGISSATCEDATNKKRFGKEHVEPLRSETGWEDY